MRELRGKWFVRLYGNRCSSEDAQEMSSSALPVRHDMVGNANVIGLVLVYFIVVTTNRDAFRL